MNAEQDLAKRLRELREGRAWSQEYLAWLMREQCGMQWTQTTVAKAEGGKRPLRVNEAAAWASLFGLSIAAVLVLADQQPEVDAERLVLLTARRELDLMRDYVQSRECQLGGRT